MRNIIIAASAAAVALPLAITQFIGSATTDSPAATDIISSQMKIPGCKFYSTTLARDKKEHFAGPSTIPQTDILKAAAASILIEGHSWVLEDRNPTNDSLSKLKFLTTDGKEILVPKDADKDTTQKTEADKDPSPEDQAKEDGAKLKAWMFNGREVTLPATPSILSDFADHCGYLDNIAQQVNAITKIPTHTLLMQAANGAVQEARGHIDPHSGILVGSAAKELQAHTQGNFGGVGIEFGKRIGHPLRVDEAIPGNPAEKAGILKGDIITKVNGQDTLYMNSSSFVEITRGKIGEAVTFTIKRGEGEPFDVKVVRDRIVPAVVKGKLISGTGIADIKIDIFNEQTLPQFIKTVAKLATEAHENATNKNDIRLTLKTLLPNFSGNGGGLKNIAEALNDLLVDSDGSKCLPIVASGKNKNEDVVCTDTSGYEIFNAMAELAPDLVVKDENGDLYTYSKLLYAPNAVKVLPPAIKIGHVNESGEANFIQGIFSNLDTVNIFEVLTRLALVEAKDIDGKQIISWDVIQNIMARALKEKELNIPQSAGLKISGISPNGKPDIFPLVVPSARQDYSSASASEITTGNLQDLGVNIIGPGNRSYGKGSVQIAGSIDEDGNFVHQTGKPMVATQKITVAGFFEGKTGGSNHGVGVPTNTKVVGDFRYEHIKDFKGEKPGLIPTEMLRKQDPDQKVCTLKSVFRGPLSEQDYTAIVANGMSYTDFTKSAGNMTPEQLRKSIPIDLVADSKKSGKNGEPETIRGVDAPKACAIAQAQGEKETALVKFTPANNASASAPAPSP